MLKKLKQFVTGAQRAQSGMDLDGFAHDSAVANSDTPGLRSGRHGLYELISPGIRRFPRRSEFLDLRKLALDPVSRALGFRRFGRRTELL